MCLAGADQAAHDMVESFILGNGHADDQDWARFFDVQSSEA